MSEEGSIVMDLSRLSFVYVSRCSSIVSVELQQMVVSDVH